MKITAGPARVIKASAPKLAIRWKSIPMGRKLVSNSLPCTGYEPSARPQRNQKQTVIMSRHTLNWACLQHCGACCKLAPEERQEAIEALTPEQQSQYLAMVGPDGWCIHFDSGARRCRIYEERPDFCRVASLCSLFEVPKDRADAFAISCCRQQIRSVHGGRSLELRKFERLIRSTPPSR